jgi:hypothetical protein
VRWRARLRRCHDLLFEDGVRGFAGVLWSVGDRPCECRGSFRDGTFDGVGARAFNIYPELPRNEDGVAAYFVSERARVTAELSKFCQVGQVFARGPQGEGFPGFVVEGHAGSTDLHLTQEACPSNFMVFQWIDGISFQQ